MPLPIGAAGSKSAAGWLVGRPPRLTSLLIWRQKNVVSGPSTGRGVPLGRVSTDPPELMYLN